MRTETTTEANTVTQRQLLHPLSRGENTDGVFLSLSKESSEGCPECSNRVTQEMGLREAYHSAQTVWFSADHGQQS